MLVGKWVIGAAFGIVGYLLAGSNGLFLGLAPLAIIAAMTNSNGSMYLAITSQFGKADDRAAIGVLSLNDGPFLTMVALALFGGMGMGGGLFSIIDFVAVLVPLLLGIVLGNLDSDMKDFLTKGADAVIPFIVFALGMGINFTAIIEGGLGWYCTWGTYCHINWYNHFLDFQKGRMESNCWCSRRCCCG